MKIAPLVQELGLHPDVTQYLVHTGQHYDDSLSRVFFDDLGIPPPDINLEVGSGTREQQIAEIKRRFGPVLVDQAPDLVVVVGDVNSTIACAEVAKQHGVKVAHVEAGLRSFDLSMPEEHNRRETDGIADYLFVTEEAGMQNLEAEGIPGKCYLVGNVMIDSLVTGLEGAQGSDIVEQLGLEPHGYVVGTFHRPSNVDEPSQLALLIDILKRVCVCIPLVLPLHPRTRESFVRHGLAEELDQISGLIVCEPLGYVNFLSLLSQCRGVITDSGGIQEETTYLKIPCLTMRENTERPVTLSQGSNVLVGSDIGKLENELGKILSGTFKNSSIPPLWDGKAAQRIVEALLRELNLTSNLETYYIREN